MRRSVLPLALMLSLAGLAAPAAGFVDTQAEAPTWDGHRFTFSNMPNADSDVSVFVTVCCDFDLSDEFATVAIDGTNKGRVQPSAGAVCGTAGPDVFTASAETVEDEQLVVDVGVSDAVDSVCSGFVHVTVEYDDTRPTGVTDGPHASVEPGCNGLDTVCYKVGAEVTAEGQTVDGVEEDAVDLGLLPHTVPAVEGVQPGPDADGDGTPGHLVVERSNVTITKDGSVDRSSESNATVPLDPDDGDPGTPAGQEHASAEVELGCSRDSVCLGADGSVSVVGRPVGVSSHPELQLAPVTDAVAEATGLRPAEIGPDQVTLHHEAAADATLPGRDVNLGLETIHVSNASASFSEDEGLVVEPGALAASGVVGAKVDPGPVGQPQTLVDLQEALLTQIPDESSRELGPIQVEAP